MLTIVLYRIAGAGAVRDEGTDPGPEGGHRGVPEPSLRCNGAVSSRHVNPCGVQSDAILFVMVLCAAVVLVVGLSDEKLIY